MGYGTESVIFNNAFETFFFASFLRGTLFIYLVLSLYSYVARQGSKHLVFAGLIMAADSVITFGRYFVYVYCVCFILATVLSGRKVITKTVVYPLTVAFLLLFLLSSFRFEEGLTLYDLILRYLLAYHIYGLFLLDRVVTGAVEIATWWGGASYSGIFFLLSKPLLLFGVEIPTYLSSSTAENLSVLVNLGESNGLIFRANAFYTMLADMLIDGGLTFLTFHSFIIGGLYGRAVARFGLIPNVRNFGIFILFLIVIYFSILKNQFSQYYLIIAFSFFYFSPRWVYYRSVSLDSSGD